MNLWSRYKMAKRDRSNEVFLDLSNDAWITLRAHLLISNNDAVFQNVKCNSRQNSQKSLCHKRKQSESLSTFVYVLASPCRWKASTRDTAQNGNLKNVGVIYVIVGSNATVCRRLKESVRVKKRITVRKL
jgi:hypothetical protein